MTRSRSASSARRVLLRCSLLPSFVDKSAPSSSSAFASASAFLDARPQRLHVGRLVLVLVAVSLSVLRSMPTALSSCVSSFCWRLSRTLSRSWAIWFFNRRRV